MKIFEKRSVAAIVMVLAIVAGILLGQVRKPDDVGQASTSVVGTYTYVYDHAGVLTDDTMQYIDAMNESLFAQTGAQIMVVRWIVQTELTSWNMQLNWATGTALAPRNGTMVL